MQDKKPSWLLITGIALLPIVFVWFTLKDRYSKKVRYFSFGWLILAFIIGFAGSEKSNDTNNLTTLKHDGYQYDGYELVGNTLVLKFSGIITPQYLNKSLTQRGLKYVALLDEINEKAYTALTENPNINDVTVEHLLTRTTPNLYDKYGNVSREAEIFKVLAVANVNAGFANEARKYKALERFQRWDKNPLRDSLHQLDTMTRIEHLYKDREFPYIENGRTLYPKFNGYVKILDRFKESGGR